MTTGHAVLITCEHGGNRIPPKYRGLFRNHRDLLDSHRGYDAGALVMAEDLARACHAPLVAATTSRLLVDLNRSIGHRDLFSVITRATPVDTRAQIIEDHYRPYRTVVENTVAQAVARGQRVLHVSSHSFTPELFGKVRVADVGLLYDPARPGEVEMCARWKEALASSSVAPRVRRNYPYAGRGDGLTSHLRKRFSASDYVGIELEVNQRISALPVGQWTALRRDVIDSLSTASEGPDR